MIYDEKLKVNLVPRISSVTAWKIRVVPSAVHLASPHPIEPHLTSHHPPFTSTLTSTLTFNVLTSHDHSLLKLDVTSHSPYQFCALLNHHLTNTRAKKKSLSLSTSPSAKRILTTTAILSSSDPSQRGRATGPAASNSPPSSPDHHRPIMQAMPDTRQQSFDEIYGPPENFLEIEVSPLHKASIFVIY